MHCVGVCPHPVRPNHLLIVTYSSCLTKLGAPIRGDGKAQVPSIVLALTLLALFTSTTVNFVYTILAVQSSMLNLLISVVEVLLPLSPAQIDFPRPELLFKDYGFAQECAWTSALSVNVGQLPSPHFLATPLPATVTHVLGPSHRSYSGTRSFAGARASFGGAIMSSGRSALFSCWRRLVSSPRAHHSINVLRLSHTWSLHRSRLGRYHACLHTQDRKDHQPT